MRYGKHIPNVYSLAYAIGDLGGSGHPPSSPARRRASDHPKLHPHGDVPLQRKDARLDGTIMTTY